MIIGLYQGESEPTKNASVLILTGADKKIALENSQLLQHRSREELRAFLAQIVGLTERQPGKPAANA